MGNSNKVFVSKPSLIRDPNQFFIDYMCNNQTICWWTLVYISKQKTFPSIESMDSQIYLSVLFFLSWIKLSGTYVVNSYHNINR